MAWDDEKEVAPGTEEGELTPEEWNEHVADQKSHSTRHESNGDDELSVDGLSGDLADEQDAKPHDIGGATHTADTLANLNSKVSDATLDDTNDPREPEAHAATHEGGSDSLNVFDLTGDLVGQGLERVNDTLQVLSSIWDGTNVVADVNNTNTTTQSLEAEDATVDALTNGGAETEIITTYDDGDTNSLTVDVDTTDYDGVLIKIEFGTPTGTAAIELTVDSAVDEDYRYVVREGASLSSASNENSLPLATIGVNGYYEATLWFVSGGYLINRGGGVDRASTFREHVIEGLIETSPNTSEQLHFNTSDGADRIRRLWIIGVRNQV